GCGVDCSGWDPALACSVVSPRDAFGCASGRAPSLRTSSGPITGGGGFGFGGGGGGGGLGGGVFRRGGGGWDTRVFFWVGGGGVSGRGICGGNMMGVLCFSSVLC